MATVYVLWHDDRYYDMGDSFIRGIYLTAELAEADVITRTPGGAKSRAYDAHDKHCCGVEAHDLQTTLTPDIKANPVPSDNTEGSLLSEAVTDKLAALLTSKNPYR